LRACHRYVPKSFHPFLRVLLFYKSSSIFLQFLQHTIHQYQILGPYSEFLGLIVPGGWEEFFRFIGEPYSGPLFPLEDDRNPFEILIPKLKLAAQEFDMVPQPQHPHFDPQPWSADENSLPGGLRPYFLRSGTGPKYLVGGTVCTPLATTKESAGRFCIGSVEGSSHHGSSSLFAGGKSIKFDSTHHCVQVADGTMKFTVDGAKGILAVGETLFIPAGMEFSFEFASALAKMYVFANDSGLVELLCKLGREYAAPVLPEKALDWDVRSLSKFAEEFGYAVSS
jgi:quercetin dioxygenase-like cupin family protein